GNWAIPNRKSDFFFGKGIVAAIFDRLGLSDVNEETQVSDIFSEGISFERNKKSLVQFGILNKKLRKKMDVHTEVFYADFDWAEILNQVPTSNFHVQPIPKYPGTERDFALLLDENISFDSLRKASFQTEKKLLKKVELFDVYTGKNLPEGKKSYALKFIFRDEEKTMTDVQID